MPTRTRPRASPRSHSPIAICARPAMSPMTNKNGQLAHRPRTT
jgi:hypothetical protein